LTLSVIEPRPLGHPARSLVHLPLTPLMKCGESQRSVVPFQHAAHLSNGAVHYGVCSGLLEAAQQLLWVRGYAVHSFANCKGLPL